MKKPVSNSNKMQVGSKFGDKKVKRRNAWSSEEKKSFAKGVVRCQCSICTTYLVKISVKLT